MLVQPRFVPMWNQTQRAPLTEPRKLELARQRILAGLTADFGRLDIELFSRPSETVPETSFRIDRQP